MSKLITRIKRLALALCFVMPLVSWAADAPTISIDGTTVTINNETASSYDSSKTLQVTDAWQTKGFWLPTGTGLEAGKVVKVTSIAFAVPSTGNFVDKIGLAGCVSASAVRTTGGFTTASADKVLFSFEDSECFLRAGSSSQIWFLDSNGAKVATSTVLNFTLGGNSNQYIDNLGWTINSVFHTPVIEVVGEIMAGSCITGAQTAIGNSGSDPLYAFGVTGWLDTANSKTGPVVLVENNDGTASIGVNNANSVNANGQHSTWSKLSGSGTLTSLYTSTVGDKSGTSPVLEVYDSSEFTGSIVTPVSQGPKLSVVFCNSSESDTLKTSYNNLFHHNGGSNPASIYVSAGRTTANNAVVTIPANKTWTANKLLNNGEVVVDGTFTGPVANTGTLTVNGTVTGTISNNGGTVILNEGATVSSFGSQRDFTGFTASVPVKITMTAEEYGKGTVSVTGANGISSITVFAPDGTTEVTTLTPENGEAAYERGSVLVSGKACWYDWEMNGNLNGSGVNTTGLSHDTGSSDQNAFYNSSMLYTYRHPYTTVAFPATWTAVVRCTVPKVVNGTVITFGTKFTSFIGLIAGDDPETEMKLVRYNNGDEEYTVLASMPIVDGTSAQHVYVFSVENNSHVTVYCDGSVALDDDFDAFTLGSGIQIGSAHGGVAGGLVRMWAGDTYAGLTTADLEEARIDCVRLYDYSLSAEQVAALSTEFPSVTIYRATVEDKADTTWGDLSWEPSWTGGNSLSKVILTTEGDATVVLPETITAEQIQLSLAADSTLTLAGPGSLTVTEPVDIGNGTLELTGTVTLTQNTAFNGKVSFAQFTKAGDGAIQLANGATVGVDAALVVTALGTYTCAEGTVVDSVYTGDDVKLIPLTSAVVSIKQGTTTLYYSNLDTALGPLVNTPTQFAEDTEVTLLNGTVLPFGYDGFLKQAGYYIDGDVITKAVAQIGTPTYPTLAAAVAAAADGATVKLLRASSEEITLNDKAITLDETANFSGTLTGNGTLTFKAFRNNPDITFNNWEGTIVLPEFAANGTILNKYGVTGSTVVLKGITAGWLNETSSQKMDVAPVLQLDGNVTITGFSTSWTYTFTEITGEGNFSLDPTDNSPGAVSITKVAEGFTGVITNNTTQTLTISTLAREAGTSTEGGTFLLGTSGDVVASALVIDGEPVEAELITKDDGIYIANFVTITVPEVPGAIATAKIGETAVELVDRQASVREDAVVTVTYTAQEGWTLAGTTEYTIDVANNETTFELDESTKATQYVASVTIDEEEVKYTSLSAAIEAASADKKVVKLLVATEQTYEIGVGETVRINKNGIEFNGIVFPEGVQYITDEKTYGATTIYTCVLATATVQYPGQEATAVSGTLQQILDGLYSSYVPGYAGTVVTVVDGSDADLGDAMPDVFTYNSEAHTYTLKTMVASYNTGVTTVYYPTLAAAVAAVAENGTVTLLADIALTERLYVNAGAEPVISGGRFATTSENKALTLDLNGFDIESTSNIALAGGSLTITGTGTISTTTSGWAPVEIRGTGNLAAKRTLVIGENVTLSGPCYGLNIFGSNDKTNPQVNKIDVTVNGTVNGMLFVLGNLSNAANEINVVVNGTVDASKAAGEEAVHTGIAQAGYSTVTVNAGAVVKGESGIETRAGSLVVNGGEITATENTESYAPNGSGMTTKGAAVAIAQHSTKRAVNAEIRGGTLTGVKKIVVTDAQNNMTGITVQAATAYTASSTLPADYKWSAPVEGVCTMVACAYVAQIEGGAKFEDFTEAVAAAVDGDTVTLLADIALTERLYVNAGAEPVISGGRFATTSENKALTLDLNGFDIESTSNIALAGGSLTITGTGTISTTTSGWAPVEIRGTGNLAAKRTLVIGENVTLSGPCYGLNIFGSNDKTNPQVNKIDVTVNGTVNGMLFVLGNLSNAANEINVVVNGTVDASKAAGEEAVHTGIAQAGYSTVTVNAGAVVKGESGIETRAGSLVVNGGEITATENTESYAPNGSGMTTKGAAVAIAQHSTKRAVNAEIRGGTLTGVKKIVVTDAQNNMTGITVQAATAYTASSTLPEGYQWSEPAEGICTMEVIPPTPQGDIDPASEVTPLDIDPNTDPADAQTEAESREVTVTSEVATALTTGGKTEEQYQAYFTKTAVKNELTGAWEVVTTIATARVAEVNADAVQALKDAVASSTAEEFTVEVPAGLYYKIETFNALGQTAVDTQKGLSTGTTKAVDKPEGTTQGFVRVRISAAPIND